MQSALQSKNGAFFNLQKYYERVWISKNPYGYEQADRTAAARLTREYRSTGEIPSSAVPIHTGAVSIWQGHAIGQTMQRFFEGFGVAFGNAFQAAQKAAVGSSTDHAWRAGMKACAEHCMTWCMGSKDASDFLLLVDALCSGRNPAETDRAVLTREVLRNFVINWHKSLQTIGRFSNMSTDLKIEWVLKASVPAWKNCTKTVR